MLALPIGAYKGYPKTRPRKVLQVVIVVLLVATTLQNPSAQSIFVGKEKQVDGPPSRSIGQTLEVRASCAYVKNLIGTSLSESASYIIFIDPADGNKIKARNGITGGVDYSGTDAAAVLQSTVNAISGTGGLILLTQGSYTWQSIPTLPKDLPHWLKIVGEGETIIRLTANGPRAFDFRKTADYDTFRNIWLENLTIDCNNVGGLHHVVVGTYQGGNVQTRINLQNITIRNIATRNVPVDSTMTNHRLNIWLVVRHLATGEKQTNINNILIEKCDFRGGNMGVVIGGEGPEAVGVRVFLDNIHIHNCSHSLLSVQSSFFYSSHFHIGAKAYGGYAHISDCYGEYSGDVGTEINNLNAVVENVVYRDSFAVAFFHTNYNNLLSPNEQTITFKNCTSQRISLANANTARAFSFGDSYSTALGSIRIEGCKFYGEGGCSFSGAAMDVGAASGLKELLVTDFKVNMPSLSITSGANYFRAFFILPSGGTLRPKISLRGIDIAIAGSKTGGTVQLFPMFLSKTMNFEIDDFTLDVNVSGVSAGEVAGIVIGSDSGSSIAGTIRNYQVKQIARDTNPTGLYIGGTGTLTIPTELRIENCDFSAMTAGTDIYFEAPTNAGKVVILETNQTTTSTGHSTTSTSSITASSTSTGLSTSSGIATTTTAVRTATTVTAPITVTVTQTRSTTLLGTTTTTVTVPSSGTVTVTAPTTTTVTRTVARATQTQAQTTQTTTATATVAVTRTTTATATVTTTVGTLLTSTTTSPTTTAVTSSTTSTSAGGKIPTKITITFDASYGAFRGILSRTDTNEGLSGKPVTFVVDLGVNGIFKSTYTTSGTGAWISVWFSAPWLKATVTFVGDAQFESCSATVGTLLTTTTSTRTATATGNAKVDTDQSKFGGASCLFDGAGDYLSTPNNTDWDFGTGDFTIDFWVRRNGDQVDYAGLVSGAIYGYGWNIAFGTAGSATLHKVRVISRASGSWGVDIVSSTTIASLTWTHVAIVRNGNTLTMYFDGVSVGTKNVTGYTYNSSGTGLYVGRFYTDLNNYYFKGWLDELRVSKGVARWTSNFTPPSQPYAADLYTSLLLHFDSVD